MLFLDQSNPTTSLWSLSPPGSSRDRTQAGTQGEAPSKGWIQLICTILSSAQTKSPTIDPLVATKDCASSLCGA